jgi:predicted transcriptional regulator
MRTDRLNIYLDHDLAGTLDQFSAQRQLKKSAVVAAALREYFSPDREDAREAALCKRFDRLSRQVEKLESDLTILTETTAIYIRYYLSVVPPVPEAHQDAARAQGKVRFAQFIEQLARHLQRGNSLARDIHDELYPEQNGYAQAAALDAQGDAATDILP